MKLRVAPAAVSGCFVSVHSSWASTLSHSLPVILKLNSSHIPTPLYVAWAGDTFTSIPGEGSLGFNPFFLQGLGLKENEIVETEIVKKVPKAQRVFVEPCTEDDWEILELHANYLEEQFLNQVQVVFPGEILRILIQQQTTIQLKIESIEPNSFAQLGFQTEIIVAPKKRIKPQENGKEISPTEKKVSRKYSLLRVLPLEWIDSKLIESQDKMYLNPMTLNQINSIDNQPIPFYYQISKILDPKERKNMKKENSSETKEQDKKNTDLDSQEIILNVNHSSLGCVPLGHILMNHSNLKKLQLQPFSTIKIWKISGQPQEKQNNEEEEEGEKEESLEKENLIGGLDNIQEQIEKFLNSRLTYPNLQRTLMSPSGKGGLLVSGPHGCGKTTLLKSICSKYSQNLETLAFLKYVDCIEFQEERIEHIKTKLTEIFEEASWYSPSIIVFDNIESLFPAENQENAQSTQKSQILSLFFSDLVNTVSKKFRIVVIGICFQKEGLYQSLTRYHVFSETIKISMPDREGRKKILSAILSRSSLLENSIDNLDMGSISSETEGYVGADLVMLTERATHCAMMRVIEEFGMEKQKEQDLSNLVQINQQDFDNAIKNFVPTSLRGAKLQKSGVLWNDIGGLSDVRQILIETLEWPRKYGALFESCPLRLRSGLLLYGPPGCGKTMIASAVAGYCGLNFVTVKGPELLNKYIGASEQATRDIFDRAAAASPCLLFFDEFEAIAPRRGHDSTGVTDRVVNQLLTELDGAGSSSALKGVVVLAATSRPDLIDPALLRPGRLDKLLLCPLPSLSDRVSILQKHSSKINLHENVDLNYWAEKTANYSGADLQALIYNAQLCAIHNTLEEIEEIDSKKDSHNVSNTNVIVSTVSLKEDRLQLTYNNLTRAEKTDLFERIKTTTTNPSTLNQTNPNQKQSDFKVVVTNDCFKESFQTTRPSVSVEERKKYERIYQEFLEGRTSSVGVEKDTKGQRVTLA